LERELRQGRGERPDPHPYQARFPDQTAAIAAVFGPEPAIIGTTTEPEVTAPLDERRDEAEASVPLPGGTRVRYFGDYELIKELGRGGMGVVYQARQISLNRPVALKMIKSVPLPSDDHLRRLPPQPHP